MANVDTVDITKLLLVEQGSTPSNPAAGKQKLYVRTSDHVLCLVDSSGTVTPMGAPALTNPMSAVDDMIVGTTGGAPARLTAAGAPSKFLQTDGSNHVVWGNAPAVSPLLAIAVNTAGGNQTTTSATEADVDATNAKVTFTAPASGNVLIRVSCTCYVSNNNQNAFLGLRESTTNLGAGAVFAIQGQTATALEMVISWVMYLTGVSGGSHTYKLAFSVNGGATFIVRAATATPMVFEVWACP